MTMRYKEKFICPCCERLQEDKDQSLHYTIYQSNGQEVYPWIFDNGNPQTFVYICKSCWNKKQRIYKIKQKYPLWFSKILCSFIKNPNTTYEHAKDCNATPF